MDLLDCLLIAWWLLAAVTIIPTSLLARRLRIRDRNIAVSAYLSGQNPGRYRFSTVMSVLPRPIFVALLISIAVLFVGLFSLIWMDNWTRLLFLNFQFFCFLFGAGCLFLGLSRHSPVMPRGWLPPIVIRSVLVIFGGFAAIFGAYWMVGDLAFPRIVVEGRVGSKDYYTSYRRGNTYIVIVNGRSYEAMRDVYLPINVGERIHAELGAVSKKIFRANRI